jgi:hypothetical protein
VPAPTRAEILHCHALRRPRAAVVSPASVAVAPPARTRLCAPAPHSCSSSTLLLNPWASALPLQRPYTCQSSFCTCSTSALASRLELRPAWSHPLPTSASPEPQPAPASPAAWSRQRRSCASPGSRASAQRRSLPRASAPVCAAPATARACACARSAALRAEPRALAPASRWRRSAPPVAPRCACSHALEPRSPQARPRRASCACAPAKPQQRAASPPGAGAPQSAAIGARGREAGGRAPWKRCCQNK